MINFWDRIAVAVAILMVLMVIYAVTNKTQEVEARNEYVRFEVMDLSNPENRIHVLEKMFYSIEDEIYTAKRRFNTSSTRIDFTDRLRNTQIIILSEIRVTQDQIQLR